MVDSVTYRAHSQYSGTGHCARIQELTMSPLSFASIASVMLMLRRGTFAWLPSAQTDPQPSPGERQQETAPGVYALLAGVDRR